MAIENLNVEISQELGTAPIHAYRVHIAKGTYSLPSYINLPSNVIIIAREISFEDAVVIDVSGVSGKAKAQAQHNEQPGEPGNNGDTGNPGATGGSILLIAERIIGSATLIAKGGDGGPGQDGENGASGKAGDPGADDGHHGRARGGRGGNGGDAGGGGVGGTGGSGGTIRVFCMDDTKAKITTVLSKGVGGQPGNPGQPGAPGAAGPDGGYWDIPFTPRNAPIINPPEWKSLGSDGPGSPGGIKNSGARVGDSGPDGAVTTTLANWFAIAAQVQANVSETYWELLLTQAENSYYNQDYPTTSFTLNWIDKTIYH
jgi:hypothetical protein